jgi:hypothetical protein
MKFKLLLLMFFSTLNVAFGQAGSDSLKCYINKLGWNSFNIVAYSVFSKVELDADSKKILALKNKYKTYQLLKSADKSDKMVIVHLILTKIVEPDKFNLETKFIYTKKADGTLDPGHINGVTYTVNGISWIEHFEKDNKSYSISIDDSLKMKMYWNKRLKTKLRQ